jgi:hypothetical protein
MNQHIGKWLVGRPALLAVLLLYTAGGTTTQLSPSMVVHGSFAVVIVCKDGIVVAADSRGTIQNSRGKNLGYYDDVQKVFVLNHNVLAYTGLETIQNLYFGAVVRDFSKNAPKGVQQIGAAFSAYSTSFPVEAKTQLLNQKLLLAGYSEAGEPTICYFSMAQTVGPAQECGHRGFIASDHCLLDRVGAERIVALDHSQAAVMARRAIIDYARAHHASNIGGPVQVLWLSGSGVSWLRQTPQHEWTYIHDFAHDYWLHKVNIHLYRGVSRAELERVITESEVWSKTAVQK